MGRDDLAPQRVAADSLLPAPSSIEAGSGSSAVTVMARDAYDNLVAGASALLSVSGSGNTFNGGPMLTDVSGEAAFTVSSTVAEAKTVSATLDGMAITQTQVLTVSPANPIRTRVR